MGFPVFVDSIRRIASLVPSSFRDGIETAVAACNFYFLHGNCTDPIGTDLHDPSPSNENGSSISFRSIIRRSRYGNVLEFR